MSKVFGSGYANAYDTLYHDKDYSGECDMIEGILGRYGESPTRSIIDLGCGTGNHTIPLSERGYEVLGVDCSQEMIDTAKMKAKSKNISCSFHLADIRQLDLKRKFDTVIMMFAVLGYQLENTDVLAALKTARRHLNPDGLLIFDVWYGPTVLAQRPTDRIKIISTPNNRIIRAASGDLNVRHHTCTIHYRLWQMDGNILTAETEEEHRMRFVFPQELKLFTRIAGFKFKHLGSFPDFENCPGEDTWNVVSICVAE